LLCSLLRLNLPKERSKKEAGAAVGVGVVGVVPDTGGKSVAFVPMRNFIVVS
jgi:hypothetical protein